MRQPSRLEIVIGAVLLALCLAFSVGHACYQGNSISEQSTVGCEIAQSKQYFGLYGYRHAKMYTPAYRNVYRFSTQYKQKQWKN